MELRTVLAKVQQQDSLYSAALCYTVYAFSAHRDIDSKCSIAVCGVSVSACYALLFILFGCVSLYFIFQHLVTIYIDKT